MNRKIAPLLLVLLIAAPVVFAGDGQWLHVFVEEKGDEGEKVRVNLPLSLIEAVIPLIEEEEFCGGKIKIDDEEFTSEQIHQILKAVREAEDGEYVHIEGVDENVRISKRDGFLTVQAIEESGSPGGEATVDVKIPLGVLEALISGEEDELDILAAIHVLGDHGVGDFVVVNDDDETVRVWIDSNADGR